VVELGEEYSMDVELSLDEVKSLESFEAVDDGGADGSLPARVEPQWSDELPIFASPQFLKTVSEEYGWAASTDYTGEQQAILPYVILTKCGVRLMRFPCSVVSKQAGQSRLVAGLPDFARSLGVDVILPANNTALFSGYPKGAEFAPYGTIINDLTRSEDAMWKAVTKDHRRRIRQAQEAGVEIREGHCYLEAAQRLVAATLRKGGLKFKSSTELKRIADALGSNLLIRVAIHDHEIQAVEICPWSRSSAYGWYAGTLENPVSGSSHLLMWETMLRAKRLGARQFNWCGARLHPTGKQVGIKDFKMRFGGQFVPGVAWKYAISPLKYKLYCLGIRLLHGGDLVDVEAPRTGVETHPVH
jgi:hypothetical protein